MTQTSGRSVLLTNPIFGWEWTAVFQTLLSNA